MQEPENEQVKFKLIDVPYTQSTMDRLKEHELIAVNIPTLKADFHSVYKDVLDQELAIPEEHCSKIKSDLFAAFCRGAVTATDTTSAFRKNFNLPKSVVEEMNKPQIILPDKPQIIV